MITGRGGHRTASQVGRRTLLCEVQLARQLHHQARRTQVLRVTRVPSLRPSSSHGGYENVYACRYSYSVRERRLARSTSVVLVLVLVLVLRRGTVLVPPTRTSTVLVLDHIFIARPSERTGCWRAERRPAFAWGRSRCARMCEELSHRHRCIRFGPTRVSWPHHVPHPHRTGRRSMIDARALSRPIKSEQSRVDDVNAPEHVAASSPRGRAWHIWPVADTAAAQHKAGPRHDG